MGNCWNFSTPGAVSLHGRAVVTRDLEKGLVLGSVAAMAMACLDTLLPSTVKLERTVWRALDKREGAPSGGGVKLCLSLYMDSGLGTHGRIGVSGGRLALEV